MSMAWSSIKVATCFGLLAAWTLGIVVVAARPGLAAEGKPTADAVEKGAVASTTALRLPEAVAALLAPIASGQMLAVLQFTDSAGQSTRLAQEMRQRVEPLVIQKGLQLGLKFLERSDLKLVMEEWKLDMVGLVKRDGGAMNLLGADLILTVRVSLEPSRVLFEFKLTRLADGQIVSVAEGWQPAEPIFLEWGGRPAAPKKPAAKASAPAVVAHRASSEEGSLRLWTDAGSYRVGERLIVHFEVTRPMHVRIIDITPAGEQTTLFPNSFQTDDFCQPGRAYRIPPSEAPFALEITAPAGKDRIKALASPHPLPPEQSAGTRGVAFTQGLVRSAPIRAMITIDIK